MLHHGYYDINNDNLSTAIRDFSSQEHYTPCFYELYYITCNGQYLSSAWGMFIKGFPVIPPDLYDEELKGTTRQLLHKTAVTMVTI